MPNYYNPQENSKKDGELFGGLGPEEAGRRGGENKGKNKKDNDQ